MHCLTATNTGTSILTRTSGCFCVTTKLGRGLPGLLGAAKDPGAFLSPGTSLSSRCRCHGSGRLSSLHEVRNGWFTAKTSPKSSSIHRIQINFQVLKTPHTFLCPFLPHSFYPERKNVCFHFFTRKFVLKWQGMSS